MNNGPEINTWQPAMETRNEPDPSSQAASNPTALPAWETVPMVWQEGPAPNLDDWQHKLERIASLEIIIAILIEKNERMRQQLAQYMD
jgi:hypothetical protein